MSTTTYVFYRGETIKFGIGLEAPELATVTSCSAAMRKLPNGQSELNPTAPASVALTTTSRAATSEVLGGFNFTLADNLSVNLTPGLYWADARVVINGEARTIPGVNVLIKEPATLP